MINMVPGRDRVPTPLPPLPEIDTVAGVCCGESSRVPLAPGDERPVSGTEPELSTSDGSSNHVEVR